VIIVGQNVPKLNPWAP